MASLMIFDDSSLDKYPSAPNLKAACENIVCLLPEKNKTLPL
ncbi:hypothetical protein VIC_003183 [Vibrio coralliilyticus ATCC BAA-450]|nr:hypothetical protein VIC_003183 [Vibrio coralliilyticus ATCC BAA-450]